MCTNPSPDGFAVRNDTAPVEGASCNALRACAKDVFALGFPESTGPNEDFLSSVVEDFRRDFREIHNEVLGTLEGAGRPVEEAERNFNTCMSSLDGYSALAESFLNLSRFIAGASGERDWAGFPAVEAAFTTQLNRLLLLEEYDEKQKQKLLRSCFWFESHFLWRNTRIADCYEPVRTPGVWPDFREEKLLNDLSTNLGNLFTSDPLDQWSFCLLDEGQFLQNLVVQFVPDRDPFSLKHTLCPPYDTIDLIEFDDDDEFEPPGGGGGGGGGFASNVPEGEDPLDPFLLDPNNPLFRSINKTACYFYPITQSVFPQTSVGTALSQYTKPLHEISEYMHVITNITRTLQGFLERKGDLKKSDIALFTLHPNVNADRVQGDLDYFARILTQRSESMAHVFSKLGFYSPYFAVLDVLTGLDLVRFSAEDFARVELLRTASDLEEETRDLDRCPEGACVRVGLVCVHACEVWV